MAGRLISAMSDAIDSVTFNMRGIAMSRFVGAALLVALVAFSSVSRAEDKKADPNGTWKWTVTRGDNRIETTLKLKLDGDKLSGTISGRNNTENKIEDATFKDGEVAFSVTRENNGNKRTTKYKGKVEGDTIKGKTEFKDRD